MSVTGDASLTPRRTGFPIGDTIGGLTAAFAIAAALVEQRSTGEGRRMAWLFARKPWSWRADSPISDFAAPSLHKEVENFAFVINCTPQP
jgi:CoA-transferase family III